jgi:tripeptide aminopeptidase
MNRQRLLQRFLQYVRVDTTACDNTETYPSSVGQVALGRLIVQQLGEIGISDAAQDEHGIVKATIPGNQNSTPVVAFNAHFDTSPETTGKDVKPQVIENFDGNDIVLPGDSSKVIAAATCRELPAAKGKTIITSDGTTLLGADDKAGVAIMMEIASYLTENPNLSRGDVRLLFTCDEEIGKGVSRVDVNKLGATVCYTFDGSGQDVIDTETFSADLALVKIHGVNIHPSIAKGKMVNAIRAAGWFLSGLPKELAPEKTEGREGFLHPYVIEGGVALVTVKILLRDFDANRFVDFRQSMQALAEWVESQVQGVRIEIEFKEQYRNMAEGLAREPRAVQYAVEAHQRLGRTPKLEIVRGGTDGSRLTELGLPTPNLSSGQHNIHSPLEWACLDEMIAASQVGIEIVRRWAE